MRCEEQYDKTTAINARFEAEETDIYIGSHNSPRSATSMCGDAWLPPGQRCNVYG